MPTTMRTRPMVPAHAIAVSLTFYGLFFLVVSVILDEAVSVSLFTAAFVPIGAVSSVWFIRRPADRLRWGHPFIFFVGVLAASRHLLAISTEETLSIRRFTLLTLGAAVVMLDTRWYAALLGVVASAWSAALLIVPGQPDARELSFSLVSAVVVGLVMHVALVSVHRKREEAVARTQLILDAIGSIGQGYFLTDGRRVLDVNDAYLALAKRTREDILTLSDVFEWAPSEDREWLKARFREQMRGRRGPDHYEARLIRGDGSIVDIEAGVTMISTSPPLALAIVRDISQRKLAEQQARAAQALKDRLTAGLSHDLRTPLTAIVGFSDILRTSWAEVEAGQRQHILDRVMANARELEDMIDELLDYSRLEHGWSEIHPQQTSLRVWLQDWVTAKGPSLGTHRVVIDVPHDLSVNVDQRAFARIIGNLIGNAAKFSPSGAKITVGARRTPGGCEVWVEDEGEGIAPDLLAQIFDPFKQGDTASAPKGVGIGLAIVRRYVELHGGMVSVSSEQGHGARFSFSLPSPAPQASSSEQPSGERGALHPAIRSARTEASSAIRSARAASTSSG